MNFWRSTAGSIQVELTSAVPEAAISAISERGISILNLQWHNDLSCSFALSRKDYSSVKALAEKRGEMVRLTGRYGMYWKIMSFLRRPVLVAGLCLLGSLVLFIPSRVLFVRVAGNQSVPSRYILEAAEDCGICFGASRREVRSEKIKNAILSEIPQLQWVGVNTAGCVATISVRERSVQEMPKDSHQVSSIVAAQDGLVLSAIVESGNPLVQTGQAVKKGQVLVSGYTDFGICIQATRSSAEIYAQTRRNFHGIIPAHYGKIRSTGDEYHKISLLLRKKRINLWKDSGISPTTCGRMYKEYYLTLPGGFQLPVALCLEIFVPYEVLNEPVPKTQAEALLNGFVRSYLPSQMVAGEILSGNGRITLKNDVYHLTGQYNCVEMIGREQPEQMGEENGKNN